MDLVDNSMNENKNYLQHSDPCCIHSMVDDYMDVSYGEKSIKITYCEKCLIDESEIIKNLRSRTNLTVSSNRICTTSR